jgi:hypothetical protein
VTAKTSTVLGAGHQHVVRILEAVPALSSAVSPLSPAMSSISFLSGGLEFFMPTQ